MSGNSLRSHPDLHNDESETIGDQHWALINTGQPVFITAVSHRRIPYLKNLVGQVAPQALPDAYETTKFLFRFDWPFFWPAAPLV